jgi:hypothetical protein
MKKPIIALCVFLIALSACSNRPLGEVDTSFGHMILSEADWSDTYPQDCMMENEGMCWAPEEGYQVLMLWVEPPQGWDEGLVRNGLFDTCNEAVIRASNDEEFRGVSGGIFEDRFYLVFYIADGAHGLELTWFGSEPIRIPR